MEKRKREAQARGRGTTRSSRATTTTPTASLPLFQLSWGRQTKTTKKPPQNTRIVVYREPPTFSCRVRRRGSSPVRNHDPISRRMSSTALKLSPATRVYLKLSRSLQAQQTPAQNTIQLELKVTELQQLAQAKTIQENNATTRSSRARRQRPQCH